MAGTTGFAKSVLNGLYGKKKKKKTVCQFMIKIDKKRKDIKNGLVSL